ncbi:hypothetical protein PQX77_006940, partial [Marasmius sp. AFHP31]
KCADSGLDWYVGGAGETPCRTYERLRQICNSNYRVGKLNPNTPPDVCDEQVASCCCNSVSFALSMLCLTCQRGVGSAGIGFDAGKGAYQMYLNAGRANNQFCSPQVNKTLPGDIQTAVCNNNIKIYDGLYNLFWGDGACKSCFLSFPYLANRRLLPYNSVYTSQTLTKDQNANPNTVLGKCSPPKPPTLTSTSTSSTPTTPPTTTSTPTTSTSTPSKQDSTTTEIRENVPTSSTSNSADTSSSSASSSSSAVAQFIGSGVAHTSSAAPSSTGLGEDVGTSDHSGTGSESGDSASSKHLKNGTIAGIAIGCLALITIIIIALLYCRRRRYAAQLSRSQPIYPTAPGEPGSPYSDSRTGLNAQDTLSSHPPSPTPQPQPLLIPLREKDPRQFAEATSPYSDDDGMTDSDRPTSEAYTTTTATDMLMMERHVDAGPIRSSMLNRAPSGRLPPAYGDLVREAGMSSAPPVPLLGAGYGPGQDQGEGPSTSRV